MKDLGAFVVVRRTFANRPRHRTDTVSTRRFLMNFALEVGPRPWIYVARPKARWYARFHASPRNP